MQKRFLIVFMTIALLMGSLPAMAADEFDISDTGYAEDIELIVNLGLASGYEGVYDVYSKITRGEFALLVSNLIPEDAAVAPNVFHDLDENAGYMSSVGKLYRKGYISDDGSGRFRPEEYIKYEEAVKIIMSMGGYDDFANESGGYPAGYIKTAASAGILNGIEAEDGYLTNGMAVRLFSNALDMNIVEYKYMGNMQQMEISKDKTLLCALAGIYYVKGQLTATKDINLNGGKPVNDGEILFGGHIFSSYDYDTYLGYIGKCYYRENDVDEDQYDVLYIQQEKGRNVSLRVQAEDFMSCDDYVYSYTNGNTVKKLKMTSDTVFIYNGTIAEAFSKDMLDIEYGYIDFLDSNGDGKYDLVTISEYYNMVVENTTDDKIYDKYHSDRHINLKDYDEIRVYNEAGKAIGIDSVTAGVVLSVFKSASQTPRMLKITVSTKSVTGTVTQTAVRDHRRYAKIDDTEYKLYSDYRAVVKNTIDAGDTGTFLMDYTGLITSVANIINNSFHPSYFIDVINTSEFEEDYNLELKAYISDVGFASYPLDEKRVKVDGEIYKDTDYKKLYTYLYSNKCSVAMIKLDEAGNVTAVDTVNSNRVSGGDKNDSEYDTGDRLVRGTEQTGARYKTETMIFEGKCAIDSGTKVFVIPANPLDAEETEFMASDSKYFTNDTPYDFTPYYLDDSKLTADIIVLEGSTTTVGSSTSIGMVKDVYTQYNEDAGDAVDTFSVNVFGANEEWQTKDRNVSQTLYKITVGSSNGVDTLEELGYDHKIAKGDIIKCAFDDKGYVSKIVLIMDGSTKEMVSVNPSVTDFHPPGYRYAMGKVNRKYGNVIELMYPDGNVEYHNLGITPIMAVEGKYFESETINGVRENDTVFVVNRGGNTVYTFLYRSEE